ncbi:hypothetical protein SK128_001656, partial [Halocaridina rubra]
MTPRDFAEKRTSPGKGYLALTPILAVLFGVLASLFLMVLVIVIIIKSRRLHPRKSELKGTSDERESPGIIHLCEAPNGNDQIQDIISVHNDHQVKQFQEDYHLNSPDTSGIREHLKPASSKNSSHQTSPRREYQDGHEGSFYINPENLLRQKGVMLPREPDTLTAVAYHLEATSTPTRNKSPTVSECYDQQDAQLLRGTTQESTVMTLPWLPPAFEIYHDQFTVQRTPVVSPSRSHVTVDPKRADAERIRKPRLTINTSECSWKATNNPRSLKRMRSLEAEDVTSPYLLDAPVFQEEWKIKETLLATSPWLYEEPHRSESLGAPEFVEGLAPWPPLVTKKAEKVRIVCPLDSK